MSSARRVQAKSSYRARLASLAASAMLASWMVVAAGIQQVAATPGDIYSQKKLPNPCVTGLAYDGKRIWVADHKTDLLYRLDARTGRVLSQRKSPAYRPMSLAWDGSHLWNLDVSENRLYKMDTKRGLVVHSFDAPVSAPRGLAWDGKGLWLSDAKTGSLRRLDPVDGTTVKKIPSPSKRVSALAWDGHYLWAADRINDKLYMLDTRKGEVIFALDSPGPHPTGLAYDGKRLIVADYQTDRFYRVVRRDGKKLRRTLKRSQEVEFTYQVRNFGPSTLAKVEVFLALPYRTPSHKLLSPLKFLSRPQRVAADRSGQKVAAYTFKDVGAGKTVTVGWKGRVNLYDVRHYVFPHRVKPLSQVPAEIKKKYLGNAKKYDIHSRTIQRSARKAVGKETNAYWMARRIYRYIHKRMHYELSGGWNTAPRVLRRGSGSCSEYTFVFIAMCRAVGIPARYVGSVVVRKDEASFDDVFHRWVEIYLPGHGWLPVDPSRGDKKTEAKRGDAFHHLTPDFLITTRSPGPSEHLKWTYNGAVRWQCEGRCKVATENIAEWSPLKAKK